MKATRRTFCGGLAALLAAGPSSADSAEGAVSDFRLPNGLTVILAERPASPGFAVQLYCDAGAAHETLGITGISHIIRNLLLLQAEAAGWKDPRGLTRLDANTLLTRGLPPDQLDAYLTFDAHRVAAPEIRHFAEARRRVIADRNRREAGWLLEEVRRTAYSAHPVGNPSLGFPGDLERITETDVLRHIERFYPPSNLILTIAGPVRESEPEPLIRRVWAEVPARPRPEPLRAVEPPQRAEKRLMVPPQPRAAVMMAWHRGCVDDPTYPVWDVLAPLLGARLKRSLVEARKLAERVHTDIGMADMKYPGLFTVLAFVTKGTRAAEAEAAIDEEIRRIATEGPALAEMAAVVKPPNWASIPDDALGAELADWQAMTGDWRRMFRHPAQVAAVKAEQVLELARQTFRASNRTVATVEAA